ncbi:hypothetical protein [Pseudomonas sp. PDM25]|uniref:hypothetical protein n=1 Tax=Pseudomonas sp. PDM25 TaxID=2854772 RepID=UPI001C468463|nr:hypothetical protein [Pseudomonas sp. PDM25]MBV7515683.1 hypothetical protein [Pseudomonas sp. PDM25]
MLSIFDQVAHGVMDMGTNLLAKNTAQLMTPFALSNLWLARRNLLSNTGEVRCYVGNSRREVLVATKTTGVSDLSVLD